MTINNDGNYDFSYDVVAAMVQELKNPNLGVETLEHPAKCFTDHILTVIKCMSLIADTWYYPNSSPRTILYAVLINTVHEYLLDNEDKYNNEKFWVDILCDAAVIWHKIDEIVQNIKNNDKLNIDNYHEMFRGDLNVRTQ